MHSDVSHEELLPIYLGLRVPHVLILTGLRIKSAQLKVPQLQTEPGSNLPYPTLDGFLLIKTVLGPTAALTQ